MIITQNYILNNVKEGLKGRAEVQPSLILDFGAKSQR